MTTIDAIPGKLAGERSDFSEEAAAASFGMKKAFGELLKAVPGAGVGTARELQNALGVDYKLCWRIFYLLKAPDVLGAANQVPPPSSIRRLVQAGEKIGIHGEILRGVQAAAERFEQTVRVHGGNRARFDAMVSGISSLDGGSQVDVLERRNAFRAETHIWGSQLDAFLKGVIVSRGKPEGELMDMCDVTAKLGWHRVRPKAPAVAYLYMTKNDKENPEQSAIEPLNPEAKKKYGAALLPEFSTQPLPELKEVASKDWIRYELEEVAVGVSASVDLAFGIKVRNRVSTERCIGSGISFQIPTARMMLDLVLHRPTFGKVEPVLDVSPMMPYGWGAGEGQMVEDERDALPIRADVVAVTGGIAAASTMEAPRWGEMLLYACEQMGWVPEEFDVYRVAIEYPVLHSRVRLQFKY